ncbi:MAG: class I SAM-dependent methyltransferase [Deltaproteobacteria bacterium]
MLDSEGFDIWSEDYEKYVERSSKGYPFEGYYDVLNYMYSLIEIKDGAKILDIGVGTGMLPSQLYKEGSIIYGIDFSAKMIKIAQEKMPKAKFYQCDFKNGLPNELIGERFNCIISSYAIHHLSDYEKVKFIKQLSNILDNDGKIIIGDVAFENEDKFKKCRERTGESWDCDEVYVIADIITKRLMDVRLSAAYKQISECAGVMEIIKG